jgi:hypothetical protein
MIITTSTIAPAEYRSQNSISTSVAPSVSTSFTPSVSTSSAPSVATSFTPSVATSFTPSVATSFTPSVATSFTPSVATSFTPSVATSFAPSVSTPVATVVNVSNLSKDYEESHGYRSALGMYCCLAIIAGCALFELLFQGGVFGGFAVFTALIFIVCSIFSIHHNRIEMIKKDNNGIKQRDNYKNKDKYKTYIDAGWIFPTTLYSILAISILIAIIGSIKDNLIIKTGKADLKL